MPQLTMKQKLESLLTATQLRRGLDLTEAQVTRLEGAETIIKSLQQWLLSDQADLTDYKTLCHHNQELIKVKDATIQLLQETIETYKGVLDDNK